MIIVYVPCKDLTEAKSISRYLTKNKLAVCINIISPIYSIYRWKGKVEQTKEALMIIKTDDKLVDKVFSSIKKLHSYNTPEIISWKVDKTTDQISNWVKKELS